jgi:hypothetical protein
MTWRQGQGPVTFRLQGLRFNPYDNLGRHYKTFLKPQLIPRRSKLLYLPPSVTSWVDNDKHPSLLRAVKCFTERSPGFGQKPPILNRISCQISYSFPGIESGN